MKDTLLTPPITARPAVTLQSTSEEIIPPTSDALSMGAVGSGVLSSRETGNGEPAVIITIRTADGITHAAMIRPKTALLFAADISLAATPEP